MTKIARVTALLTTVPYFGKVNTEMLQAISAVAVEREYTAGQIVFLEGDASAGLFIVEKGFLKSVKISTAGREQVVRVVGPGEVVNAIGVLASETNPGTVMALENATVWCIMRDDLLRLLDEQPALAGMIIKTLAGRIQQLMQQKVGLWRIGASPMAMMLGGVGGMGAGLWRTMLLPMLGLAGMTVMMFVMYRMMTKMGRGMAYQNHVALKADKKAPQQDRQAKQTVRYTIPGISCGGCKQAIEGQVAALAGVSSVQVDVASQQATIDFDGPATKARIEQFLVEIGYPVLA